MRLNRLILSLAIPLCTLLACTHETATVTPSPISENLLLTIAQKYPDYGKVDDTPHMAPVMCAAGGPRVPPPTPQLTRSDPSSPHGQKRFFLYASHPADYLKATGITSPAYFHEESIPGTENIAQILVKESFQADLDPKITTLGPPKELFIMLKFPDNTPNTDHGWFYATITPDHKQIIAQGQIATCMACHDAAPHNYLFGLSKPPQ